MSSIFSLSSHCFILQLFFSVLPLLITSLSLLVRYTFLCLFGHTFLSSNCESNTLLSSRPVHHKLSLSFLHAAPSIFLPILFSKFAHLSTISSLYYCISFLLTYIYIRNKEQNSNILALIFALHWTIFPLLILSFNSSHTYIITSCSSLAHPHFCPRLRARFSLIVMTSSTWELCLATDTVPATLTLRRHTPSGPSHYLPSPVAWRGEGAKSCDVREHRAPSPRPTPPLSSPSPNPGRPYIKAYGLSVHQTSSGQRRETWWEHCWWTW